MYISALSFRISKYATARFTTLATTDWQIRSVVFEIFLSGFGRESLFYHNNMNNIK